MSIRSSVTAPISSLNLLNMTLCFYDSLNTFPSSLFTIYFVYLPTSDMINWRVWHSSPMSVSFLFRRGSLESSYLRNSARRWSI